MCLCSHTHVGQACRTTGALTVTRHGAVPTHGTQARPSVSGPCGHEQLPVRTPVHTTLPLRSLLCCERVNGRDHTAHVGPAVLGRVQACVQQLQRSKGSNFDVGGITPTPPLFKISQNFKV